MGVEPAAARDVEIIMDRNAVVTALPLKRHARDRLGELLHAQVIDVRDPVDHVDLVLTPACSPQLIAALKKKYGGARAVVVELDDADHDIELSGPVKRICAVVPTATCSRTASKSSLGRSRRRRTQRAPR